ncbi:MAG: TolC family protein [Bacteroidales bacterium]|nr:TolC family protein [Bacteroidales bacterium]
MSPVKCYFFVVLLFPSILLGQSTLTLSDAIRIATDSSLAAFRAENLYKAGYWEYRSYLAQKKPSLTLNTTPLSYNRSFTQRYNSVLDIDEYRQQQSLYSYANASLSQNLPFTGGSLYVDSEIGRLQNFGDNEYTQFSSVPIRIGLIQPILGYNRFKWQRKIEPLKYEIAKKSYVQSTEAISLQMVNYYFDLLAAQIQVEMSRTNLANADTLYNIGQKRLEIATQSQADVLTLKVTALSARNELATAIKQLQSARFMLYSFLKLNNSQDVELKLPDQLPDFQVTFDKALAQALENNPDLLDYRQQVLESESTVERTRRNGLMDASLMASYGLNQQSTDLPGSYRDPLNQQNASLGVSIPIIDWGQRRGQYNMAKNNYEAVKLSAEQAEIDFRQTVMLAVSNFNMQHDVVTTAFETREAARQAYNITKQRFIIGKTDVNSLTLALERQDQANLTYIEALRLFWSYYYTVRRVTLYDFENDKTLMDGLDEEVGIR